MRKKSHISLARYLVRNLDDGDLRKHKLSFYIGSRSISLFSAGKERNRAAFLGLSEKVQKTKIKIL